MKYIKSAANALILLMLFQCPLMAETVLLEDDFDHYPSGDMPYKGPWLDGMSESGAASFGPGQQAGWTSTGAPTEPGDGSLTNPRRIVAAPGNRPGLAFSYSELSAIDGYPCITAQFDPFSDQEQIWETSIDFFAEKINSPAKEDGFGIIDVRSEPYDDADGKKGWTLLTKVLLADNEGFAVIVCVVAEEPGGKLTKVTKDIELNKWYQLRIQGDNKSKTLAFFLDNVQIASGHYVADRASVGSIVLGDVNAYGKSFVEPGSIISLDNFKLQTRARP